jgi:hypothetical protein
VAAGAEAAQPKSQNNLAEALAALPRHGTGAVQSVYGTVPDLSTTYFHFSM